MRIRIALAGLMLMVFAGRAMALTPDELVLIVNSNEPAGIELAKHYAEVRHVPEGRILSLDLPTTDTMPFRQYEEQVVPAVRDFLRNNGLEQKTRCLVTFYGVPLRIENRVNTAAENGEVADIRRQLRDMPDKLKPSVVRLEAYVRELDPTFEPQSGDDLDRLQLRVLSAVRDFYVQLGAMPDDQRKWEAKSKISQVLSGVGGDDVVLQQIDADLHLHPEKVAAGLPGLQDRAKQYQAVLADLAKAEQKRWDPASRKVVLNLTEDHLGLLSHMKALQDQLDYLDGPDTAAAFDSELPLVMWNYYIRSRWIDNPFKFDAVAKRTFTNYMTARIDAPSVEIAKGIIDTSIKVEAEGLKGKVVIDSLGVFMGREPAGQAGYGIVDGYLRDTAKMIQGKSQLPVTLEETQAIIPPGTEKDVALYCGWHSAGQYVHSCYYNPGAVGFHIASYELQTLRGPGSNAWVRGLLADGMVSTFGPVEEPFTVAFPRPDEYFPLVLTGKLTMAEVYWKTIPSASWKMAYVGDPLYVPYKTNPVLKVSDLPFYLRAAIPKTQTSTAGQ